MLGAVFEPQEQENRVGVELERERADQRRPAGCVAAVAREMHILDALAVPGGQADKREHAHHTEQQLQRGRSQVNLDDTGEDRAEETMASKLPGFDTSVRVA